ncbi:MAG TPA: hypothetical protein VMF64_16055 [Steroidobacteraceae bacterium]|nr:hypothetical protein [Steroidobacteraceae bacterium]
MSASLLLSLSVDANAWTGLSSAMRAEHQCLTASLRHYFDDVD